MVAIDNTTLALLLHPKAKPPNDPQTKLPLEKCKERIEQLIYGFTFFFRHAAS